MYIVLLETSGNQRFIFSTNKLRENVGASELTYQIGTTVVREVIKSKSGVTEIITTSGKALLLVENENTAREIVREVTLKALTDMPGLTVHGAISLVEDGTSAESLHKAIGDVHRRLEEIRYQIPSNLQRFQRIPFVAECASSNLPAEKLYVHESVETKELPTPQSVVSIAKQEKAAEGKRRLENSVISYQTDLYFAGNPNDLDSRFDNTNWFAVIHADGNGLGQIFLDFQKRIKAANVKDYVEKYREFSDGLDKCTTKAAAYALKELQKAYRANREDKNKDSIKIPAIPLVLGGDDLTIICDGQYAVKFTKDFLDKFVEETKTTSFQGIFPNGIDLGICAGIAIIKPHYPFHQAYHLAEQLLRSAKKSKEISPALSALDYHVLYDTSGVDLDEIRGKFKGFKVARPYVVSDKETAMASVDQDENKDDQRTAREKMYIENHHFSQLGNRVRAMVEAEKEDENKRKLPNSQLHTLRERLHLGPDEADAFAKTVAHRYDNPNKEDEPFKKLYFEKEPGKESLFFEETDDNKKKHKLTHFLDAMEIAEFWKGFEN